MVILYFVVLFALLFALWAGVKFTYRRWKRQP